MTPFLFLVMALSTARVTHLVVEDVIPVVKAPRDWVERRWPGSSFAYLVTCTYCASVWVAAAHVFALDVVAGRSVENPVFVAAALSASACLVESLLDWMDRYGAAS